MASIAGHAIATVFATAEIDSFRFFSFVFLGRKRASLVTTVAKWLSGTFATGAVPVAFSSFNINGIRGFLGDMWFIFGHV